MNNDFIKQERLVTFKKLNLKRFNWDIITMCNYNCEYCYARANKGTWSKISSSDIINKVINQFREIEHPMDIILLGGEPTLHPKYFKILEELDNIENIISIRILSNGNFGNEEKAKKFIDKHSFLKTKFSFLLTYHVNEVNKKEFFNIIKYIKDKYYLEVNLLFDENTIDENLNILKELDYLNIKFRPSLIFNGENFKIIEEEKLKIFHEKIEKMIKTFKFDNELKFIKENGDFELHNDFTLYLNGFKGFKNWKCYMSEYFIDVNSSYIYEFCTNKKVDTNYINNNQYLICPLEYCICPGKISLLKEKQ
jgi:MoaA/NifB/PqqE/SkfB family radical SAM enzyme